MAPTLPFAFIFDMDGTLVDNMPFHNRVWVDYMAEIGSPVDPHAFHDRTAGKTNPEIFRLYFGDSLTETQMKRYAEEKEIRYRETYRPHMAPVAGLIGFLERALQAGITLAVATSAPLDNIDYVMDHTGLRKYFNLIVGGHEVQHGKPNPEIFLKTSERLGIAPERCLVFEDSLGGIQAGYRAGMPVLVITTGMNETQALQLPGVIQAAPDFSDLDPLALITAAAQV